MEFEPKNDPELGPLMEKIREVGGEYGSTTGRPRQCNFLDLESLYKAVLMNGVNTLVMSKVDVLRTVPDAWRIKTKFENEVYVNYKTEEQFKKAVRSYIPFSCDIIWSESKETI
jgi:adenylosuccinate synthase